MIQINSKPEHAGHGRFAALTLGALGIVYGDIGTSPLYALDQIFGVHPDLAGSPDNVLGALSLVVWTLTIIVAIKYAVLVLRAQNDGEGGVFALYGLLHLHNKRGMHILLMALMLGAGLLFGDGFITPAISVLSAVEGLGVATPALSGAVVPITCVLLTLLFAFQFKGTSGVAAVFAPVLLVWFAVIAAMGLAQIVANPGILWAFNPWYGLRFLATRDGLEALLIMGALMLVVTGGEAMYADLGHFGAAPIRASWFGLVYPALLLNYLGQGAFLLSGAPLAGGNLFFSLVPHALLYPMVLLATAATVIASQALISGAFTLAAQATRLGLFPRLTIRHTHHAHAGQVYMPFINWGLYVGCIALVLGFGSSERLGAAYGLAVAGVMVITSLAMIPVSRLYWGWSKPLVAVVWGALALFNGAFLVASPLKFSTGRVRADDHGPGGVPGHGDLALGAEGDVRGVFVSRVHDDVRSGDAAPVAGLVYRAERGDHGGSAAAFVIGSRSGAGTPALGTQRRTAPPYDFRGGHAPQSALRARRPLPGDGVRP